MDYPATRLSHAYVSLFLLGMVGVLCAGENLTFEGKQLTEKYYSEGVGTGDFNKDGHPDVVFGPYWYEGPQLKKKHAFITPKAFPNDRGYANNFFSFVDDFDRDGWQDILIVGLPGTAAKWYRNLGESAEPWPGYVQTIHPV